MKLFCTIICSLGAVWTQTLSSPLAALTNSAANQAPAPLPAATLLSDRVARQAALDIGWDLAHALGHSSNIPNAGRTIPEMG